MKKYINLLIAYINKNRWDIVILTVFFIYACLMTWPFIIKPSTTLTAPLAGDVSSSVTKFDSIKQESKNPLVDWHLETIAAPEGITTNTSVDRISFFSTIFLWSVTTISSSVIAHGLFTLSGYFLTASVTYLFLRKVFKNKIIGAVGGGIYASFPLFISLARAAPIYIHMWLYVLPLWAFYNLWQRFTILRLVLAILSIVPALFWTPYFAFHILLIAGSVLLIYLGSIYLKSGWKKTLKLLAIVSVSWIMFVGVYYLVGMSSSQGGAPERTIQEIYDQSLHPLMLVLPGAFSWWGQGGYELLFKIIPRAYDTNLYLGISTLLLAGFGLFSIVYKKIRNKLTPSIVLVGLFAATLLIVALLFSLAPTISIFGLNIPTPNAIIAHVMPALRAGQRLVMPIMLGVIVLAMIGLYVILVDIKRPRVKWIIATMIAIVLFLDLSSKPPLLTAQLPHSDIASALSSMPDGPAVQYVNGSITGDPGQIPCQLRLIHQKTIVNFCGLEINYPKGELQPLHKLALLPFNEQLLRYKVMGVKYIIAEKKDYKTVDTIANSKGISRLLADNRFILYEINY
jgi:hypothetical protein